MLSANYFQMVPKNKKNMKKYEQFLIYTVGEGHKTDYCSILLTMFIQIFLIKLLRENR